MRLAAAEPCLFPLAQGAVSNIGPFTRWYFDKFSGVCKTFQYSGYGGNQNNFKTKENCVARCVGKSFINK